MTYINKTLILLATFALIIGGFSVTAHAQYYGGSTYNYGGGYSYSNQGPLNVTCYSTPINAAVGQTVRWHATAYGGNGSYNFTWSGDGGLSGYGQDISTTYSYSGYKNASVTVISGGQSVSKNCDNTVNITGGSYNPYPTYYPTPYPTPYPTNYYTPLYVSCSANSSYVNQGTGVTWTAYVTGGSAYSTYSWTGTDNLYGTGQSIYFNYQYPGTKTASVTVYSNGQTITQACTSNVTVGSTYNNYNSNYYSNNSYTYPTTYPSYNSSYYSTYPSNYATTNYNGLDIGCYADPTNAKIGQPVTWNVEVTGGAGPYSYSWTGSDGLNGSAASVIKYYSTSGSKSAIVTVNTADGKSGVHACSNTVAVTSAAAKPVAKATPKPVAYNYAPAPQAPAPAPQQTQQAQVYNAAQAAGLFSLANIPWGWVAILVILVLFFTVLYLMFNKHKI